MSSQQQRWSEEELSRLADCLRRGQGPDEIRRAFPSRSYESIRHACKRYRSLPQPNNESVRVAAAEMKRAADRGEQVRVESLWDESEEVDVERLWKLAEAEGERAVKKAREQCFKQVTFPSGRVAAVSFLSDQHIAPGTPVDFKRMREDAELIRDTRDLYCILGGDGTDNHIKHPSAIIAARSQPSDQWTLYGHYLTILRDKILVVISGNHEWWTNQIAGLDVVKFLTQAKKVQYVPHEARITGSVGQQTYQLAVRHQYRYNSSFNQNHAALQWLRLGEAEFDIGALGHHHEACLHQTVYRGKVRWVCRPGSYQITSAYSQQYGYNNALPTVPTFLLFPDKRHIIGLADVRDAPQLLRAFNG